MMLVQLLAERMREQELQHRAVGTDIELHVAEVELLRVLHMHAVVVVLVASFQWNGVD